MTKTITDDEIEDAKEQLKKRYKDETGNELPDHVVENLELLGPQPVDLAEIEKRQKLAQESYSETGITTPQALGFLAMVAISGFVGLSGSRFFVGWPAQIVGGILLTLLTWTVLAGVIWITGTILRPE